MWTQCIQCRFNIKLSWCHITMEHQYDIGWSTAHIICPGGKNTAKHLNTAQRFADNNGVPQLLWRPWMACLKSYWHSHETNCRTILSKECFVLGVFLPENLILNHWKRKIVAFCSTCAKSGLKDCNTGIISRHGVWSNLLFTGENLLWCDFCSYPPNFVSTCIWTCDWAVCFVGPS